MDASFKGPVVEGFGYSGFYYTTPSFIKSLISCIVIIGVILVTHLTRVTLFTRFVLLLIVLFSTFPSVILYKNMGVDPQILIAHLLFFTLTYTFMRYIPIRIKSGILKFNQRFWVLLMCSIIMIIPFFVVYRWNINLMNLLLVDIYETRAIYKEMSNPFLGYTYSWLAKIILPITIIFSIHLKSHFGSMLLGFMLLYVFLIGAHKSVLFGSVIIITFYFVSSKHLIVLISLGVLALFSIAHLSYMLTDSNFISSLIARRVFFLPALLDVYYFDFFKGNHLYWSGGVLSSIFEYPYQLAPQYLIGSEYFDRPEMSANNGIISDGYANLGWLGVILNLTTISLIFSFLNSLRINSRFFGVFLLFFFSVLSSYLPTVLLTHGGLILLFLSQFILKDTSGQTEALNYD